MKFWIAWQLLRALLSEGWRDATWQAEQALQHEHYQAQIRAHIATRRYCDGAYIRSLQGALRRYDPSLRTALVH
jgi:hypothetical protein